MIHKLICTAVLATVLLPFPAFATSNGLSLTITPTLFEMSAFPTQEWKSSIRVINSNQQPLTVYAKVVNFMPQGEFGRGKFLPVFENFTEGKTLAEWITVPDEPILIASEGTASIPVTVTVPADAAPGGHYAAVMVGTQPPEQDGTIKVSTSQVITSLFLVRIAGDVIENGVVRTFRVLDSFVQSPEATIEFRFENKGNVHLQPQGEIVITNMWGKERGIIPINYQTNFGNVLPESIRRFEFTWKGESSFTDIGRYKATLTLAYGQDSRKFATQATYFWVIPVKQVFSILAVFIAIILIISWTIRSYVRRMISVAGVSDYVPPSQRQRHVIHQGDVRIERAPSMKAPIEEGVRDFKERLAGTRAFIDTIKMLYTFVLQYKKFFIAVVLLTLSVSLLFSYFSAVTKEQRDYEITIGNPVEDVTLSSEEIMYERDQADAPPTIEPTQIPQAFTLRLTNSGDTPGAAAALQQTLEHEGYTVSGLTSDFGKSKDRTVIVYDTAVQDEALILSKMLNNALLSALPEESDGEPQITVFIGNDYEF